jgi:hypothetical protein
MTTVVDDETSSPTTEPAESVPGPVAAALLASGFGSAVFGAAVLAAESSETVKAALTLDQGVGPLSGKTVVGSLAYVLGWTVLHLTLRRRTVRTRATLRATAALLGAGLLLTFPPVYQFWSAA